MKIGLQTWGSEGDVRPFAALAAGLTRAGHDVTLVITEVAERDYSRLAARHGFRIRMVGSPVLKSPREFMVLGAALLLAAHPALQARLLFSRALHPVMPEITAAAVELCRESDLVIGHFALHPVRAAAEQSGIPYVSVQLVHGLVPSRYRNPPGFFDLGPSHYPMAWKLARWAINRIALRNVNTLRRKLQLPTVVDTMLHSWASSTLNLITVSTAVFERPADWAPEHVVCGFLDFPAEDVIETIPAELVQFLDAGAPPVFFGFGSLVPTNPTLLKQTVNLWRRAAAAAGVRAVMQLPDALLGKFAMSNMNFFVGRVPHRALFPRCAVIVHHGGSGTTQAALLAGRPSVVVAHVADQFLWGDELVRLGAASASLRRLTVRSSSLGRAVGAAIKNPRFAASAGMLGDKMRHENGVETAVRAIESINFPAKQ